MTVHISPASARFTAPDSGLGVSLELRPLARRFLALRPAGVSGTDCYPSLALAFRSDEAGMKALLEGPVESVVDSDKSSFLSPAMRDLAARRFPVQTQVGDLRIYQRRGAR